MTSVHEEAGAIVADSEKRKCPGHYDYMGLECSEIEKALSDKMMEEETGYTPYEAHLYLASVEYVLRGPFKNGAPDFDKAVDYLTELSHELRGGLWERIQRREREASEE